jgi:cytochrome c-type biogenesis protein CcsB
VIGLVYALLWLALPIYIATARTGRRWLGWLATSLLVACLGLLTAGLVSRGLAAGHWPLTNRYEFTLGLLWAAIAIYLLLEASLRDRRSGPFMLGIALLLATYLLTRPAGDQAAAPLLPALRSGWLPIHVLSALFGYAAFGVAAGLGLMRLVRDPPSGESQERPWLPSREAIERTMERAIALGFPWLTLSILTGAIWAQQAWGRYWGWDPKETWALITWLWYLLILHARTLRGWRGRRLAWLVIVGFGVVIFALLGVPWLVRTVRLQTLHGF